MSEIAVTFSIREERFDEDLQRGNDLAEEIARDLGLEVGDAGVGFGQRDIAMVVPAGRDRAALAAAIKERMQSVFPDVMVTVEQDGLTAEDLIPLFKYLDSKHGLNPRGAVEDGTFTWDCDGTLRKTKRWLKRHPEYNAEEVLAFVQDNGGFCDCEVCFNVLPLLDDEEEEGA